MSIYSFFSYKTGTHIGTTQSKELNIENVFIFFRGRPKEGIPPIALTCYRTNSNTFWGRRTRTLTSRTRICRATITQSPIGATNIYLTYIQVKRYVSPPGSTINRKNHGTVQIIGPSVVC